MPLNVAKQRTFEGMCDIQTAVEELSLSSDEDRGAIFTRPEVVEFILDLAGYKAENDLTQVRLLEPSFGHGEFLLAAIDRLMLSWRRNKPARISRILPAIRAVELHRGSFDETRKSVRERLEYHKLNANQIDQLVNTWLVQDDFLLWDAPHRFDVVAGNPPYVRLERVPDALMSEYRTRYQTMFDRADLYIPFIERSLDLLTDEGKVAFICADRWMKNRYGGPLRKKIANNFGVGIYVDMVNTPAFHSDVIAYPAITVLSKSKPSETRVAIRPEIEKGTLSKLSEALTSSKLNGNAKLVREVSGFISGDAPWLLSDCDSLMLARRLEETYPTLEEAGCKVGIGVATGADKVFIREFESLDVEPCRKLPLATTRDIVSGDLDWRGLGVINPFKDEGGLVDLKRFPKLGKYLNDNAEALKKRHVAKKSPANWYRTIDRITPALVKREKLLIPDIKGHANIVFESGELYPHHNLYFITSDDWDLQALKAVLTSGIAHLFVSLYSTKMRGDYLRFQAQHLRRIRIPHWKTVPSIIKRQLKKAGQSGSLVDRIELTAKLFGLSEAERSILERKEVNE